MRLSLRALVTPTASHAILSLLISLILLVVVYQNPLTSLLAGASHVSTNDLQHSYHQTLVSFSNIGFVPKLTIGLFWASVGVMAYFLMLTVFNFIISLRNEVIIDTTFTNTSPLTERFRLPLIRLGLTVAFGVVMGLSLGVLEPLWLNLAGRTILNGLTLTHGLQTLAGILGLAVNVYLVWDLGLTIKNLGGLLAGDPT